MRCTTLKSPEIGKWILLLGCFTALPASAHTDDHFNAVIEQAKQLAEQAYQAPEESLPSALKEIDYDTYRQIRFSPDQAYWRDESPFNLQLFHSGFIFQTPITLNIIEGDDVTPLPFSSDDFQYDDNAEALLEQDLTGSGHAGFRLHYPLNNDDYADEFAVFLGASYFRLVGQDQTYGLSTRGLAIDTASSEKEEFPAFREFWLYKPGEDADEITLLALLDSPSLSGAYRITLRPGEQTNAKVEAELFARHDVAKLGIAPLTSMYTFGESSHERFDDFRPQVHDSDGLLIHTGADEWIWRPLSNPQETHISSFVDNAPHGFGLMQRERDFSRYLDMEAHYHQRPSQWVAPIDAWGAGHVELVEIPTPDETHDNIVAYWVDDEPLNAGDSRHLHYHTHTLNDAQDHDVGRVIRTRHGKATIEGSASEGATLERQFVVDFQGGALDDIAPDQPVKLDISTQTGNVTQPHVMSLPDNMWRASFRVPPTTEPSDIRLRLMLNNQPISETWNYVWYPDA
ncbi:Glucans biosynthesis protein G precursor [Halomonas citrativorans]|uniref:Glucans biosynthesis protein G n=1 Tax=Halomonas citrativorans TaxID=2742612 RepID=A0A1R4I2S9_9GAMM|nr:glucan biosynthesis protein G [Halomonas citrativorans]SJN14026.1 Glucans biosynthesis protein G precursor [Halomonas citrativorans]